MAEKILLDKLTPCELAVLQLYADGLECPAIAGVRNVGEETINTQRKKINDKLNGKNILDSVMTGLKLGIIENRNRDNLQYGDD